MKYEGCVVEKEIYSFYACKYLCAVCSWALGLLVRMEETRLLLVDVFGVMAQGVRKVW